MMNQPTEQQQQRPDLQVVQTPQISPKRALFNALERARPEFGRVLPRHLSEERFLQISFLAIKNNPALTECTAESVVNALIVALAADREQQLAKTFDTLERVWEEYHVYEKRDDAK